MAEERERTFGMEKEDILGKRKWSFLILAEALLLVAACIFYGRRETVELNYTQEELIDDSGEAAFYLERSSDCRFVGSPKLMLPKGMYTLTVQYEGAGEAKLRVVYPGSRYRSEVSGDIPLSGSGTASCDFRVAYGDRTLQVRGLFSDEMQEGDYLLLRNIKIARAGCDVRNFLFRFVFFLLAADGILFYFQMRKQGRRILPAGADRTVLRALVLLVVGCSIPLAVDYLFLNSHDLYFHLMRIEGIRAGLENGMFPVRIQPGWLNGHGYAASVFYGDFFLYVPALLRYFGVSVQAAYKCYVVMIHMLTVGISYYSFSRMSRPRIGLVCTVLYSLNIYRLTCIYTRAAVGEYTAMTFMPLVLYGLWLLYTMPEDSKRHRDSWIPITAGCTGIFLSHMISTEITAFLVVLSALVLWRRVIRKRTMLVILKAVSATALLNAWFLVPFLDYMVSGTYVINDADKYGSYRIEQTGIFVAQLFMGNFEPFGHSLYASEGIASEMPLTVGIALMAVPAVWFLLAKSGEERKREEKREAVLAVCLCFVSLWMATCHFPYTWLAERLPVFQLPIVSIQYLWRFLTAAAVLLTWLLCLLLREDGLSVDRRRLIAGVLVGLAFWQGFAYMGQCLQDARPYRVYQAGNMSTMKAQSASSEEQESVMGGEYLPLNRNEPFSLSDYVAAYVEKLTYDEAVLTVEGWIREGGAVTVGLENRGDSVQQMEVPLLYYKGYHAVTDKGEPVQITPGTSYRISLSVPPGFAGSIRVEFGEPLYWRGAELVSAAALLGILLYKAGIPGHKRRK